jgi:hypothetical protein
MMQQIENILKDEESFRSSVEKAENYVDRYWLGEHLQEWVNLYTTNFGDPRRKEQTDFYERNKEQFE